VSPANSVGTHVVSEIHDAQRHLQSSEDPVYIAYKLVDINLSLTYDYLYTKFGSRFREIIPGLDLGPVCSTIHRLVAFVLTCVALVLFRRVDLSKCNGVDVVASYVLLVGAIILEVSAIFMGFISSYWSHMVVEGAWNCLCCCCCCGSVCFRSYFRGFEWSSGVLEYVLSRLHPENRGQWSGNLAQYNLIGRHPREEGSRC
jgi:hypothetical protein